MATFGEMKTWVSKRLQDPGNTAISSSDVGDLLNSALSFWKTRRYYLNERTDTATMTTGDATIPLPSDWLVPSIDSAFVIEYSGIRYPLKKVSASSYNAMYLSNGIGQPFWYAKLASQQYQTYPIPDKAYTVRRFLIKNYDAFESDGSENDFSTEATGLLQYTAAAWGMRDFRQDMNMHDAFWAQAGREYNNIMVQTRKANATGSLTLNSLLI